MLSCPSMLGVRPAHGSVLLQNPSSLTQGQEASYQLVPDLPGLQTPSTQAVRDPAGCLVWGSTGALGHLTGAAAGHLVQSNWGPLYHGPPAPPRNQGRWPQAPPHPVKFGEIRQDREQVARGRGLEAEEGWPCTM